MIKISHQINLKDVYALKACLHILEDQFEDAYQYLLKGLKIVWECILKALKTQLNNPNLKKANNLRQLLGDRIEQKTLHVLLEDMEEDISKAKIFWLNFFKQYKEVYDSLLQDRPQALEKFEKAIASLEFIEGKEKDKH